jgi:hypothetical protein
MATKVKILKMLQEMKGLAEITNRRPPPRLPGLFLVQMRSHLVQTTGARRKRTIAIDVQELPEISHPVKINHVQANASPAASMRAA